VATPLVGVVREFDRSFVIHSSNNLGNSLQKRYTTEERKLTADFVKVIFRSKKKTKNGHAKEIIHMYSFFNLFVKIFKITNISLNWCCLRLRVIHNAAILCSVKQKAIFWKILFIIH